MAPAAVSQLLASRLTALRAAFAAAALILACSSYASSDLLSAVNAIRMSGCPGRAGATIPLRQNPRLDDAARRSSKVAFPDALKAAGYRATRSLLIRIAGDPSAAAVARFAAREYCSEVTEPSYTEAGIHREGREARIVLAAPFAPPPVEASAEVAQRVLQLINSARSQPRTCGAKHFAAAPPLRMHDTLNRIALAHATDMARHSYFSHQARDGSTPPERVRRGGYRWRSVGENLAAGPTTPEAVVSGWINSPGHCATLMEGSHSEMGIAYVVNPQSIAGIYWVFLGAHR